jgi:hypothetical protein
MKPIPLYDPILTSWRGVRCLRLWAVRPDVRDILDILDKLIPFSETGLPLETSEHESTAYAAFTDWFDEAETAGLITIAEEVLCLHSIGYAFHPV